MSDGGIFKRLTKLKAFPYLILAITAGVLLLVLPTSTDPQKTVHEEKSALEYTISLEEQLTELIEEMEGVRCARVLVYADSSYSYLYASDQEVDQDESRRKVTKKLVLATTDGDTQPIVIEEYLPSLSGIAVVVDCGDEATLLSIKNMLCSLFDLDESRIFITS